jgi:hypothetical protein
MPMPSMSLCLRGKREAPSLCFHSLEFAIDELMKTATADTIRNRKNLSLPSFVNTHLVNK